jgi:hypothetical protein
MPSNADILYHSVLICTVLVIVMYKSHVELLHMWLVMPILSPVLLYSVHSRHRWTSGLILPFHIVCLRKQRSTWKALDVLLHTIVWTLTWNKGWNRNHSICLVSDWCEWQKSTDIACAVNQNVLPDNLETKSKKWFPHFVPTFMRSPMLFMGDMQHKRHLQSTSNSCEKEGQDGNTDWGYLSLTHSAM